MCATSVVELGGKITHKRYIIAFYIKTGEPYRMKIENIVDQ